MNLYAEIKNGKVRKVIMPDQHGQMRKPAPRGIGWYAVKWPVNPHFTGENQIIRMIEDRLPFKEQI